MAEVFVSSAAEQDYTDAFCWYAERNVTLAEVFETAVNTAFTMIGNDPLRFPVCDDRHRYYHLQRFPFQIIYRHSNADVTIVAIAHTSRSPNFWEQR